MATKMSLAAFERGYVECALWCGAWDGEERCHRVVMSDLTDDALQMLVRQAANFEHANRDLLDVANAEGRDDEYLGHDFWLTRNRHGAGFWDGRLSADLGAQLTERAHDYGECDLHLNANGQVDLV